MTKLIALATLIAVAPLAAFAEDAAPAPATAVVADSSAPPSCKQPVPPSRVRRADDPTVFQEKFDNYRSCIKTYVDEQSELSKKHIAAANAAIKELNDYVAKVNEIQNDAK